MDHSEKDYGHRVHEFVDGRFYLEYRWKKEFWLIILLNLKLVKTPVRSLGTCGDM